MGISELASVEGMSESKSLQDVVPDYQAVTGKSPMSWSNEHGYIRVVNTDNSQQDFMMLLTTVHPVHHIAMEF